MTIRAGIASDKHNALSTYKLSEDGRFLGGLTITGFSTKLPPGAICGNGIQRAIEYAAHHLQRILAAMIERRVEDPASAKEALTRHLAKVNDGVNYIGFKLGQGIYLAGVICYVAGEELICLPFGGACAYLWTGKEFLQMKNQDTTDNDPAYICDALGGGNNWTAIFDDAKLPVMAQLVCVTSDINMEHLIPVMSTLTATNPQFVAEKLYAKTKDINEGNKADIPFATLAITSVAG